MTIRAWSMEDPATPEKFSRTVDVHPRFHWLVDAEGMVWISMDGSPLERPCFSVCMDEIVAHDSMFSGRRQEFLDFYEGITRDLRSGLP